MWISGVNVTHGRSTISHLLGCDGYTYIRHMLSTALDLLWYKIIPTQLFYSPVMSCEIVLGNNLLDRSSKIRTLFGVLTKANKIARYSSILYKCFIANGRTFRLHWCFVYNYMPKIDHKWTRILCIENNEECSLFVTHIDRTLPHCLLVSGRRIMEVTRISGNVRV